MMVKQTIETSGHNERSEWEKSLKELLETILPDVSLEGEGFPEGWTATVRQTGGDRTPEYTIDIRNSSGTLLLIYADEGTLSVGGGAVIPYSGKLDKKAFQAGEDSFSDRVYTFSIERTAQTAYVVTIQGEEKSSASVSASSSSTPPTLTSNPDTTKTTVREFVDSLDDIDRTVGDVDADDIIHSGDGKVPLSGIDRDSNTYAQVFEFTDQGGNVQLGVLNEPGRVVESKPIELNGEIVSLRLQNSFGSIEGAIVEAVKTDVVALDAQQEKLKKNSISWFSDAIISDDPGKFPYIVGNGEDIRIWGYYKQNMSYGGSMSISPAQEKKIQSYKIRDRLVKDLFGHDVPNQFVIRTSNGLKDLFIIDLGKTENITVQGGSWIYEGVGKYDQKPRKVKIDLRDEIYKDGSVGNIMDVSILEAGEITLSPDHIDQKERIDYPGIKRFPQDRIISEQDKLPSLGIGTPDEIAFSGYYKKGIDYTGSTPLDAEQKSYLESLVVMPDEKLFDPFKNDTQIIGLHTKNPRMNSFTSRFNLDLADAVKIDDYWLYTGKDVNDNENRTIRIDVEKKEYTKERTVNVFKLTLTDVGPNFGLADDRSSQFNIPPLTLPENPFTSEKELLNESIDIGGETPTYYDKHVYALGNTQAYEIEDLYIHDGGNAGDITLRHDTKSDGDGAVRKLPWLHLDPIVLPVDPSSLKKVGGKFTGSAQGTANGVTDTRKYTIQIDEVTIDGVKEKMMRVSVDPPSSFTAIQQPNQANTIDKDLEKMKGLMQYPLENKYTTIKGSFHEPRGNHVHAGIDISCRGKKVPVFSAYDGIVTAIETQADKDGDGKPDGFGTFIVIEHTGPNGEKFQSRYGHISKSETTVGVGDTVKAGELITKTETDPNKRGGPAVTGAHLHFEIRNRDGDEIDPLQFYNLGTLPTKPTLPTRNPDIFSVKDIKPERKNTISNVFQLPGGSYYNDKSSGKQYKFYDSNLYFKDAATKLAGGAGLSSCKLNMKDAGGGLFEVMITDTGTGKTESICQLHELENKQAKEVSFKGVTLRVVAKGRQITTNNSTTQSLIGHNSRYFVVTQVK